MASEEASRGMDIVFFDPGRRGPTIGRHGKITGLGAPGLVHITIWCDPDLDLKGPLEIVRGVPLYTGHVPPEHVGRPYCRPVKRDVVQGRGRGRPPKSDQRQTWQDQQWDPAQSIAVRRNGR